MPVQPAYNEKELLLLIAQGDDEAYTAIFNLYWNNVYSVALVLTKSEQLAEDVVQEVFLKVWQKRNELSTIERFDNYLFIIARNHIFSEFKKLKIREEYIHKLHTHFSGKSRTPEDEIVSKESAELINKAISRLPEKQQQVYRLSRESGLSHEAIAEQLGISAHTVRNHIVKAIQNIREFLMQQDSSLVLIIALIEILL